MGLLVALSGDKRFEEITRFKSDMFRLLTADERKELSECLRQRFTPTNAGTNDPAFAGCAEAASAVEAVTEEARTDIGIIPARQLSLEDFRRWGLEGKAKAAAWRKGLQEYIAADPKVLEIKKLNEVHYGQEITAACVRMEDLASEFEMLRQVARETSEELRAARLEHRRLLHLNNSITNHTLNKLGKLLCKRKVELAAEFKRQWRSAKALKRKAELLEGKQADHAQV